MHASLEKWQGMGRWIRSQGDASQPSLQPLWQTMQLLSLKSLLGKGEMQILLPVNSCHATPSTVYEFSKT